MPSLRTAAIALAIASGTLLLTALAITLYGHRHELDWGNVPTWFAGLFAVIASGISLRNYRVARASYEHNLDKRNDDYAAQARLVVIQYDELPGAFGIAVKNYSDSIVVNTDLDAYRIEKDGTRTVLEMDQLNSGHNPDEYVHQTLGPGRTSREQVYVDQPPSVDYIVTFVDARGTKWRRVNKDQPTRVIDNPK